MGLALHLGAGLVLRLGAWLVLVGWLVLVVQTIVVALCNFVFTLSLFLYASNPVTSQYTPGMGLSNVPCEWD